MGRTGIVRRDPPRYAAPMFSRRALSSIVVVSMVGCSKDDFAPVQSTAAAVQSSTATSATGAAKTSAPCSPRMTILTITSMRSRYLAMQERQRPSDCSPRSMPRSVASVFRELEIERRTAIHDDVACELDGVFCDLGAMRRDEKALIGKHLLEVLGERLGLRTRRRLRWRARGRAHAESSLELENGMRVTRPEHCDDAVAPLNAYSKGPWTLIMTLV